MATKQTPPPRLNLNSRLPLPPSSRRSLSDIKALGKPKAATKGSIFDRIGERYALLVGVRNYDKTSGLHPLRYTEKDATELANVLLEYGYRPENVILMTDSQGAKNPKLLPESRKIQTQLKGLLRDRGKADQVMIAFSGHGLQFKNDKDSYFCPLDAQVEKRSTLISMGSLYKQLEDCPASFKMLLCDACRDDPMIGTSRGLADVLGLFRDAPTPPGGVAVFYACSPGEYAREDPDLGHGVFFNFIIEGLRGAADMDNDGKVMLPELEYHAKRRVSDFVRHEFGGQRQMPNLKGNLLGLVALTDKKNLTSPAITPPDAAGLANSNPLQGEPIPNLVLEAMARIEADRQRQDSLPQPTPTVSEPTTPAPAITEPPKPAGDPTIDITAGPSTTLATSTVQNSPLAKMPVMMPQTGEVRRFEDMGWGIDSLAFSPNGRWLAGGKSDSTLLLFDVPEGGNLDFRDNLESLDQVTSVAFSPNGQRLLAAGSSGLIKVFEVKSTGRLPERGQYVGHNNEIHSMHIRSDGKFVLSGGRDGRLHFWQLDTGRLVRAIEGLEEDLQAACFDDATTALATDGEVLLRIDLTSGEIVQRFKLGYSSPHAAAFSADGSRLVVSEMYNLHVWDTRTGRKLGTCEDRHIQWIVRFTPQGDRLVSGGDGCISVWDLSSFFRVQQVDVADGTGDVQSLAVAPDGQHVAAILSTSGEDLQVFRISQEPSSQLADIPEPSMPGAVESPPEPAETALASSGANVDIPKERPSATTRPRRSRLDALPAYNKASGEVRRFDDMGWGVKSLAFSPDGRWLAAGKSDRALLLLDVIEGGRLDFRDDLESHGQVTCVRFSPNGKYVLVGGYSGRIDIWSISRYGRMKEAARYVGQNEEVKCICIRDDSKYVLSGGEDQKLHFWELATGRIVKIIDGFEDAICAVQFADDTTALVTDGEYLKRIDLKTSEVTRQFKPDCRTSQAAAFSPNGQFLVLSDTYDLALFDTRSGRDVKRCETNETPWTAVFTSDGKRLISGGRGRICVWNVETGFKIHETKMANGIGYVQTLAVAPDGRHVAAITSSSSQDLQVFRLPDR